MLRLLWCCLGLAVGAPFRNEGQTVTLILLVVVSLRSTGRKRKSEAIVLSCASRKKARPMRLPQLAIEQENRNHWTFDPVQKSKTEFPVAVESCWQDQVLWARLAIASPYSTGTYTTSLALSHFALSGHSSLRCVFCVPTVNICVLNSFGQAVCGCYILILGIF